MNSEQSNTPTRTNPMIIGLLVLVAIVVLAGAIVTVVNPTTLSFHDYVQDVTILAAAFGIGAGVGAGLKDK